MFCAATSTPPLIIQTIATTLNTIPIIWMMVMMPPNNLLDTSNASLPNQTQHQIVPVGISILVGFHHVL